MINAAFWMAEQLYGLTFTEITGTVPVFHPDVRVWEVKDKASGAHVGLFYGDYFARAGKRSGAWASGYRSARDDSPARSRRSSSNNNNFVKGAPGEPVLISLDDAETLFHEFGHALHGLLSEVNYPGLGTTPRDFVEYPSQVHEQWVLTRPVLDTLRPALQDRRADAAGAGRQGQRVREVQPGLRRRSSTCPSAIVDMELHTRPDGVIDPDAFERDDLERIGAPTRGRDAAPPAAVQPPVHAATPTRPATTATCGPR